MSKTIEFLRTLPEKSGQIVNYCGKNCYFLWFYNDQTIDLAPIDNITILAVSKRFWDKIELVF